MTNDKKIAGTWEGSPDGVNRDEYIRDLLDNSPDNSLSLLHTHTNNTGFSVNDFRSMCKYLSIKDIGIKCLDGTAYSMSIKDGVRAADKELLIKTREITDELLDKPRYKSLKDGEKNNSLFIRFIRERNDEIKKAFHWD